MIKVLQIIDSLNTGGAEMVAINIANALSEDSEVQAYLCATRAEGCLKAKLYAQVEYIYLQKNKTLDFKAIIRIIKYIKKQQINIVHAHSSSYFLGMIIKVCVPQVKFIMHIHLGNTLNLSSHQTLPLRIASYFCDQLIVVNKELKKWASSHLKTKNVHYLANFPFLSHNTKSITKLHGKDGKRIICLANLRPEKDHLNLLEAFNAIANIEQDWTLHFVGNDLNDDYSLMLKEYIVCNALSNRVFIYGGKNDVLPILKQCEIGVLSSISEGLPMALLEYGIAQLAVIVTDVGECKEVVSDENNGLVIAPQNKGDMKNALLTYIQNIGVRKQKSINFAKRVTTEYTKKGMLEQLIELYR